VVKEHGVHYTPPELADFLARRLLARLETGARLSVLDPAAGEGELLAAVAAAAGSAAKRLSLVGVDRDERAVARAHQRLTELGADDRQILVGDFLQGIDELDGRVFDAVISNPPYVRTQVLGAVAARELAERFELTGRVDLYQAFVRAMTERLRPGGVLALLCSNRFLSVQAGAALREALSSEYELCEIYDLGDTKLFAAAVLPAIVIARRGEGGAATLCRFTRVYERDAGPNGAVPYSSVVAALEARAKGAITVDERLFEIEQGGLARGSAHAEPWRLTHEERERWLATVAEHTEQTFEDVAPVRVGIKTTADSVFIRRTWDDIPEELRPEPELVRPLITHHVARRWHVAANSPEARSVLYPHCARAGKRATVDLAAHPRAAAYLELHRGRLERRSYVIEAGRQWFEVWVPQQPAEWPKRKVVFPDIAESPQFSLDTSGAIVNGDCYWMSFDDAVEPELISLVLAVGNSSFAVEFYDAVCGNRLYAGRRRFITQYVKRFPLPRLDAADRRAVHERVEALRALPQDDDAARVQLETELDVLVRRAFGLREEVAG
jgi:adenine-specific DNA-methyltransferase